MKVKGLDIVWLLLLAATAFTWWLGHSGALVPPRLAMMALVFGLAWLKGLGVILEFMELRHAPAAWRWGVLGWLWLVMLGIVWAYLKGMG